MLDNNRHKIILVKILKEIYSQPDLRQILGLKGGTAAFLVYGLPRFSVDLDFDLLRPDKKETVLAGLKTILPQFGQLKEATEKKDTLFFLLTYEKEQRNVKIEISKRKSSSSFVFKSYLGIPLLVMEKEDMASHKLSAFLTRKKFASRDVFDLWFFLKNEWGVNETAVKEKTGLTLKQALQKAIYKIKMIKTNQLLQGMGDLLDNNQKEWVKKKMKEELLFYLKLCKEE